MSRTRLVLPIATAFAACLLASNARAEVSVAPWLGVCKDTGSLAISYSLLPRAQDPDGQLSPRDETKRVHCQLYWAGEKGVFQKTDQPVVQWTTVADGKMLVYYPETKEGYEFVSRAHDSLPLISLFALWKNPDLALVSAGFRPVSRGRRGVWKNRAALEMTVKKDSSGRAVHLESRESKGILAGETFFSDVGPLGVIEVPRLIRATSPLGRRAGEVYEYALESAGCSREDPTALFRLPPDAKIRRVEW